MIKGHDRHDEANARLISKKLFDELYEAFAERDRKCIFITGPVKLPPVDIELLEKRLNLPYELWSKRHD